MLYPCDHCHRLDDLEVVRVGSDQYPMDLCHKCVLDSSYKDLSVESGDVNGYGPPDILSIVQWPLKVWQAFVDKTVELNKENGNMLGKAHVYTWDCSYCGEKIRSSYVSYSHACAQCRQNSPLFIQTAIISTTQEPEILAGESVVRKIKLEDL